MQLWAALSTNYASAASVARCLFFSLALCVLGFAPPAAADTFTVTSRDDTDTDDTGTFRWAVDQANQNGTGSDTIVFDEDLIANAIDGVIEIALNSALEAITSELIIEGPVDTDSTEYVVSIYRDPNIGDAFVVNESLTLHNALLQSNAILFNGGTNSTGTTIDLVFEVGDNLIEDVYWFVIDSDDDNDPVEDGRLVKTGLGELALLPTTADYDGGTVLVDGVLRTDTRSLQGDIQLCANSDPNDGIDGDFESTNCDLALLIFEMPSTTIDPDALRSDPPTSGTYEGDITSEGDAKVVKIGEGSLTLTGTNSYTGGTYIMEGEVIGDTDAIQGDVYTCPGANNLVQKPGTGLPIDCGPSTPSELTFDMETDGTFVGELHGRGTVRKDGDAELTFATSHANFGGELRIGSGDLVVDAQLGTGGSDLTEVDIKINGGSLLGSGTIYGGIEINSGGTAAGSNTVEGRVDIDSGGTLSGTGTYNRTVSVNRGGDLTGSPTFNALVKVKQGGDVSGSGTFNGLVDVKRGGEIEGALILNGDLQLEGKLNLTSDRMTATTATIENRGIIAIDIESATTPEPLDLSSTLTLESGSVDVAFDSTYAQGLAVGDTDHFTIAESDVAITTRLSGGEDRDGIRFKTAIFDLELLYDDARCSGTDNVCLQTTFAPILEDDADTNSQREIAHALDLAYVCAQDPGLPQCGIHSDTADDFNDLYGNFAVSSRDIPDILDAVAPEEYGAIADMRAAAAARFNRSISRRFDLELTEPKSDEGDAEKNAPETNPAVSAGPRSRPLGANARNYRDSRAARMPWRRRAPPGPMPIDRHAGKGGFTSWLDVHGVMGELDGGNKFEDVDYRIYGPLFGLDYGITDTVTAGVTLGYTRNELRTPGAEDKATANSYQGGAYVGAVFEDFYVTGAARYAYGDFETRRRIRFRSIDRTATADFETSDVSAFLEAAYDVPIPQWPWIPDNTIVQPQVALAYSHLVQSSFDESDAGSLNLEVDKQELDALQSSIGVRVALLGRDSEQRYLLPQLRIAYEREWLDTDRPIDAHLPAAGSGGDVKIDGIELPRDRAVIGVSSEVGVSDRINLFVDYDLRAAPDLLEHSLAFGLRALW